MDSICDLLPKNLVNKNVRVSFINKEKARRDAGFFDYRRIEDANRGVLELSVELYREY